MKLNLKIKIVKANQNRQAHSIIENLRKNSFWIIAAYLPKILPLLAPLVANDPNEIPRALIFIIEDLA